LLSQRGTKLEVVLVDPDDGRARGLAAKLEVDDVAQSHHQIIDRVDAAIIASPHHTHVPVALDLVDAGVAVLCEKPLGTTVAEVEALRDLALERGVTVSGDLTTTCNEEPLMA
jgi:myo-inositol 2-dehydrogenase/D-chiro-inositol 1-dehydrogenase